jgi:hypothetical protein
VKTNAVSVTVYDLTGSPINPKAIKELEKFVEKLVKQEGLVYSVATA